jgi:hypothetical protein
MTRIFNLDAKAGVLFERIVFVLPFVQDSDANVQEPPTRSSGTFQNVHDDWESASHPRVVWTTSSSLNPFSLSPLNKTRIWSLSKLISFRNSLDESLVVTARLHFFRRHWAQPISRHDGIWILEFSSFELETPRNEVDAFWAWCYMNYMNGHSYLDAVVVWLPYSALASLFKTLFKSFRPFHAQFWSTCHFHDFI